jgi:hypothetical protein
MFRPAPRRGRGSRRRRAVAAVIGALIAAACSPSGTSTSSATSTLPNAVGSTTVTSGGSTPGGVVTSASRGGGGSNPTTTTPGTAASNEVAALARGGVGAFAPAVLRANLSSRITVELLEQQGAAPTQPSLDHLVGVLRAVSGKTVEVTAGSAVPGGARAWSTGDIVAAADAAGRAAQGGGRAVLRLLFLHGSYGNDDSVLGVAVRGDVAAIFSDEVQSADTPLIGSGAIESAVITHEVGHLMGLVDLYLHTGRADPAHPGHSRNRGSVMYWAVESDLVAQLLGGGPPNEFDDADRADLARIRAG